MLLCDNMSFMSDDTSIMILCDYKSTDHVGTTPASAEGKGDSKRILCL